MMNKKLETLELTDLRKRYTVEYETDNKGWSQTDVKVFDNEHSTTEPIYEYHRNYSMLRTFEPFRLWDDQLEKWRNFALISPKYTNFQVLDLDNRTIIAKNPNPTIDEEQAAFLNKISSKQSKEYTYEAGQEYSGWRFCPAEFHVPDICDVLSVRDIEELKQTQLNEEIAEYWNEWIDNFLDRRTFGFEAGCVWGDDWSYKVQAIDLTKILEGKVSDDDRFGYLVYDGDLKDLYDKNYYDDDAYQTLVLNVPVSFKFDKDDQTKVSKSEFYGSDLTNFQY